jgi:hypothetical protein
MNKYLFIFRKLLAWGNPDQIERLNLNPEISWWESYGWGEK